MTGRLGWSGEHVPETAATESSPAGCEAGGWSQLISSLVFYHIHCGFRRLLRSTLPAVLWVSLVGVPLRRWVGSPHRSWTHWLWWIRWVWGRWTRARIWWRIPLVHRGPVKCTLDLSSFECCTGFYIYAQTSCGHLPSQFPNLPFTVQDPWRSNSVFWSQRNTK